jgi:hypothetical protein
MTKDEALKLAQEPGVWGWQQAPIKTMWGDEMVVADLAIDRDHTVSVYCERDQTAKVEAMFTPPAAQRQWAGLTDEELLNAYGWNGPCEIDFIAAAARTELLGGLRKIETKLKEKNT